MFVSIYLPRTSLSDGDKKTSRLLLPESKKSRILTRAFRAQNKRCIVSLIGERLRERERERESNQIIGMAKEIAILFRCVVII